MSPRDAQPDETGNVAAADVAAARQIAMMRVPIPFPMASLSVATGIGHHRPDHSDQGPIASRASFASLANRASP